MDRAALQQRVRETYDAFARGDFDTYTASFSPDIVWHVPGDNQVSGRYMGQEYFTTMPERMAPLDEWRITPKRILFNEKDNAALVEFHLNGSRKGKRVEMDGYHMIRLTDDGKVAEGWGFTERQDELDEFFSI